MTARTLTSGICLSLLLGLGAARADDKPPLLNYLKMQALKDRLAQVIWEVEVRPKASHPAIDPQSVPRRTGQGVVIEVPNQGPRLMLSGDLVRNWSRIEAQASGGRLCTPLEVTEIPRLDVVFVQCTEPLDPAVVVPLAPDDLAVEGALVFSVDDPTGKVASIYHGFLAGPAEAPLAEFHYVHLGGFWSYPLLNHRGELVAFTLRRVRPQPDTLAIAVTCKQLREMSRIRRREPEGPSRLRETTRRPFHYD